MRKSIFTMLLVLPVLAALGQDVKVYRNPVVGGFHPDPSICRVGDDYYLVNSSFQYFPAVPIYHSTDLVSWEQVGNVLDRESQVPLKGASSWLGIYAPTIRYDEGLFYMVTTNVGGGGNFYVTAEDPKGPWSEPKWLKQGGIDPSFYFEGGKCYFVSNPGDAIWLCEIDPKTGEQLTESRKLWQGTGGRYPEGPHIYKKDGYYYLLISEGGTEYGHMLTIARSRNIYGPYKANPANPILCHQRRVTENSPIQGTGHGDFVQAKDGSWWLVFLAFRTWGGNYHHLGRETFLAPVEWPKGGWPVVNGNGTVDTLMKAASFMPSEPVAPHAVKTSFGYDMLGPEWLFIQNPVAENYELLSVGDPRGQRNQHLLRLHASATTLSENDLPTFIGRRQEWPEAEIETEVTLVSETGEQEAEAGLAVYQIHNGHYDFSLVKCEGTDGGFRIRLRKRVNDIETQTDLDWNTPKAFLRVVSNGENYRFECSSDGTHYQLVGEGLALMLSSEVVGGFTGVTLGMYCHSANPDVFADFSYFDYREG